MILTCPVCTTRYMVAEGAIGAKGRRVRCASCGHQWMQEPEIGLDEELFGEAPSFLEQAAEDGDFQDMDISFLETAQTDHTGEDDFQAILRKEIESVSIPEGVRPVAEEEDLVLAQLGKPKKTSASAQLSKLSKLSSGRVTGFIVAACFYFCIFGLLLILQSQISRLWPASNMIYTLVGMQPFLPGEGLSLDELKAEMDEDKIHMSGTISNLRSSDTKVPSIVATIVGDDEKPIDRVLIAPPVARLKAEGQAAFNVVYPKLPEGATNVTFAFSFMKPEHKEDAAVHEEEPHTEDKAPPPSEAAPTH